MENNEYIVDHCNISNTSYTVLALSSNAILLYKEKVLI